ncbi:MAG: hypothetical protein ACOH2E_06410 [Candidatus Paracaedibacter sp.]
MGIIYRHQKKEPLTIAEMDGNFATLEKQIKNLESNPPLIESIATITQEGDRLTFQGTFGTILGHAILPKAFPNYRQKWQVDVAYHVLDWVQVKNSLYSCTQPHTSKDFSEDQASWALVFEV